MGRGREEIRHLGRSDLPVVVVEDLYEDGGESRPIYHLKL